MNRESVSGWMLSDTVASTLSQFAGGWARELNSAAWYMLLGYAIEHLLRIEAILKIEPTSTASFPVSESHLGLRQAVPYSDRELADSFRHLGVFETETLINLERDNVEFRPLIESSKYRARASRTRQMFDPVGGLAFRDHLHGFKNRGALSLQSRQVVVPPPAHSRLVLDLPRRLPNTSARKRVQNAIQQKHNSPLLAKLFYLLFPVVYLEGIQDLLDGWTWNRRNGYVGGPPWFVEERLWLAVGLHEGLPRVFTQHGGTYGQGAPTAEERYERTASTEFVDWWTPASSGSILPSLRVAWAAERVRALRPHHVRGEAVPSVMWVLEGYRNPKEQLGPAQDAQMVRDLVWSELPTEVTSRLLYRPKIRKGLTEEPEYPSGYGRVGRHLGDFYSEIANATVVVCESPFSTSFFESLGSQTATLCYAEPELEYSRDFAPIASQLESLGILHTSADSLICAILEAYASPRDWCAVRDQALRELLPAVCELDDPAGRWAVFLRQLYR